MSQYKRFEELPVWQRSKELAISIYRLTQNGGIARDFGLRDQIRRSAISISSNIAEGFERGSSREFAQYLFIAKGSAGELRSQLLVASELDYLDDNAKQEVLGKVEDISRQLSLFIQYLRSNKAEGK